jgi:hypothetical protein
MVGLDGEVMTTCDCMKEICLHQHIINHYSDCIPAPALQGGEPEDFLVFYKLQEVDYLFSVTKTPLFTDHNAAKRTIVTLASQEWTCKSCPRVR